MKGMSLLCARSLALHSIQMDSRHSGDTPITVIIVYRRLQRSFIHSHSFTRTQLPYQMKNSWKMFQFDAVARDYRHGDGDISRFGVLQTKVLVGTRRK